MQDYIITSYYTVNTPYQKAIYQYLIPSLIKFNLQSDIRGVSDLGSWQKNTSYKPSFLKFILKSHPNKNIIFLDADAEILQIPILFNNVPDNYFIAAHILDRDKWYNKNFGNKKELLTGTLFLRNVPETLNLLNQWENGCNEKTWEQKILYHIIQKNNIPIYNLPIEYCWIKTLPNGDLPYVKPKNKIVIAHNQFSRNIKK